MGPSQSPITQWGWGFHILQSSIDPGDLRFFLWVVRVVEICMYGFVIRGWELILPGCGGTLALARRATFAARCLHEPHPISNHPVGLGFPHPAGRYRPGESPFSSPRSWSCRYMEAFLIMRGWEPLRLGVCWLYVQSPANQRSDNGTGVSTPYRVVSTWGITVFVHRLSEL